jgi:hypothetical protein
MVGRNVSINLYSVCLLLQVIFALNHVRVQPTPKKLLKNGDININERQERIVNVCMHLRVFLSLTLIGQEQEE